MSRTLTVLALITASFYARQTDACTALPPYPVRLFQPNAQIPGNLVYFKVLVEDPGPLLLTTLDGTLVPSSIRTVGKDRVFAPDAPVPVGTALRLTYQLPMSYGETTQTLEFSATDVASISLRSPRLKHLETLVDAPNTENGQNMRQRFAYTTPDANGSLAHLIDYSVTIDGRNLAWSDGAAWPTLQLNTVCGQTDWTIDSCGGVYRAPEGDHVLDVTPQVVGLEQQPAAAELFVQSSCDADGQAHVDGAGDAAEAQADPKSTEKAQADLTPADNGCSLTGRSHHGKHCAWASLLVLAILLRRKPVSPSRPA